MNARTPVRRIAVGLAVAAALATSACAAGQVAGTADQKTTLDGTNVDVGNIALRGLAIETPNAANYPVGSNLVLKVVIVNNSTSNDTLTSISSTAAASWGSFDDVNSLLAATALSPGSAVPATPSATDPASTPAGTLPSASTSTASTADAQGGVKVTRGVAVSYGVPVGGDKVLALTGTKKALYPGATVPITFTFAKAGSKTFPVPIQLSDDGSYTPSPEYLPSGDAGEGTG